MARIGSRDAGKTASARGWTDAADALGSILGRNVGEDVLDAVFSRFCIGK